MPPYTLDHPFGAHRIHSRLDDALRNVRTNGYSFIGSMSPIMATMPAASTPARPLAAACPPNSLQQYSAHDTDKISAPKKRQRTRATYNAETYNLQYRGRIPDRPGIHVRVGASDSTMQGDAILDDPSQYAPAPRRRPFTGDYEPMRQRHVMLRRGVKLHALDSPILRKVCFALGVNEV